MERVPAALYQAYGLEISKIERIKYGLREECFAVWTSSKKYFAKRFWYKERIKNRYDQMLHGLELSQFLRTKGFPVPELLLTKEGKTLGYVDGEVYQVTEWIDGDTYYPGELPIKGAYAMGRLLGKFHSFFEVKEEYKQIQLPAPLELVGKCKNLLLHFEPFSEPFANMAKQLLKEQINILESLPHDFVKDRVTISRVGPVYSSFWVEQIIFDENLEVKALIDWTDGAGRVDTWIDDINTALCTSAFDKDAILAFYRGYQEVNPISKEEWDSVLNLICYKRLGNTGIYDSWLNKNNRRMEYWEKTAAKWCRQVPVRFYQWQELKEAVIGL